MAWIEPVSTVVTAASLVNDFVKGSDTLKKHYTRIINRIAYGKVVLPIFGAGGAGKSTAGKILVGNDPLDVGAPYRESWTIEPRELPGEIPGQIIVAPGQLGNRIDRYWPDLILKANNGVALGIINVVAYGFHSTEIGQYSSHDIYEPSMTTESFLSKYTENRRRVELALLDRLLTTLAPTGRSFFMVTVVAKQDLWWTQKEEVKAHYTEGEYQEKIKNFGNTLGWQRFHHEFIPTSLTISNLTTPSGEIMHPTSPGYDLGIHLQYLQGFFDQLHNLVERHQKSE